MHDEWLDSENASRKRMVDCFVRAEVNMNLRATCLLFLEFCERHFRSLEIAIPAPQWVPWQNGYNWRYVERTTEQILLQKLARQISGVRAADTLFLQGHLLETGCLFRILDEIHEDILYLTSGVISGHWTENHRKYCEYFWSESDDDKEPPVRRKSIRAFVHRAFGQADPSSADANGRLIHKTFSDFVHARSAPSRAMVAGMPPKFLLDGIHDGPTRAQFVEQMPCYFYRCSISVLSIARIVFDDGQNNQCYAEFKKLEAENANLLFGSSFDALHCT